MEYQFRFDGLQQERIIKNGSRGSVVLVRSRDTGKRYIYREFAGSPEVYLAMQTLQLTCLPRIEAVTEQDGTVAVLEEYIQGDRLDDVLAHQKLTEEQARNVMFHLCTALGALHSLGIVHRDVKPENVILRGEEAVLIDFDVSRMFKQESHMDTQVMGTAGYAAPEQFGFSQTDARTDIYALGVLFNVMLTGQHPSKQLAEGTYRAVIEKCIEVNADKRYGCVEQLQYALKNGESAPSPKKRGRFKWIAVFAVMCGLLAMLWYPTGETEPQRESVQPLPGLVGDVVKNPWGKAAAGYTTNFTYDLDLDGVEEEYIFGVTFDYPKGLYGDVIIAESIGIEPGVNPVRIAVPCVWRYTENGEPQIEYAIAELLTQPQTTLRYLWNEDVPQPSCAVSDGSVWKGGLKVEFSYENMGTWLYGVSAELDGQKLTAAATTSLYDSKEALGWPAEGPAFLEQDAGLYFRLQNGELKEEVPMIHGDSPYYAVPYQAGNGATVYYWNEHVGRLTVSGTTKVTIQRVDESVKGLYEIILKAGTNGQVTARIATDTQGGFPIKFSVIEN